MAKKQPFALVYADEVKQHLRSIETKYHSLIQSEIESQLLFEPDRESRNRKPLQWPIAFGASYQVNADNREVRVVAVGVKDRNRLLIGEEEMSG